MTTYRSIFDTQYHMLQIVSDDFFHGTVPIDEEEVVKWVVPHAEGRTNPGAVAIPPHGAAIGIKSENGPIEVMVNIGVDTSPADCRSPDPWVGEVKFDSPHFYVSGFGGAVDKLARIPLPRGIGNYLIRIDWLYQPSADFEPEANRPNLGEKGLPVNEWASWQEVLGDRQGAGMIDMTDFYEDFFETVMITIT